MSITLTPPEERESLFTLSNGRQIDSYDISRRMELIVERHPEISHPASVTGYSWDECGMAQLFAECYNANTRYCPEVKSWYTYSAGAWRRDTGALLVSANIKEFYRLLVLYCGEIENMERRTDYLKFVTRLGDRRFRERLLKDAADNELLTVSASEFDSDPYLINCLNGTYDLKSMVFREHKWQDFLTMQTAFEYTLQDASCERWEQFISEVTQNDASKAEYLQKAIGYSMLGTANEECMFILHGKTTRNGKSTLLSAIHHLLGDYATVSPVSVICKPDRPKNPEAANPVMAGLKGRRVVTMAESDQYGKLDEETIKQLTGGEEISTRNLYEGVTTWLPQFTLWLSCNDLPAVRDKSLFASDRIRVIEFNRHFTPEEQDKGLKTLFQQPDSMRGIFTWMLEGYAKYRRHGLTMPPEMQKVILAYQKDNDLVLQFLEEKCEKTDPERKLWSRAKGLYDAYKMWCKSNGYYVCSAKKFNAEMETHPEWHGGRTKRDGYPVYKNIVLRGGGA